MGLTGVQTIVKMALFFSRFRQHLCE